MALVEGIIILGTILYILYKFGTKSYDHWEKKGVKYIKASYPFLGSNGEKMLWNKETLIESSSRMYNEFPKERFVGAFMFRQPVLVIRDPELIRKITIKDFDHFSNRNGIIDPETDPLFGKSLVNLKDQQWRDMRNTLSPVFTSSKMKSMFVLVNKCGEQMTNYLDSEMKRQVEENHPDGDTLTLEFKAFFRRFTNDVIATTAFGIQIDSLKDPKNDFYTMGENVTSMSVLRTIKFFLYILVPFVMRVLRIPLFGSYMQEFFRNLVKGSINQREEQNIVRPDLIHILMLARKGTLTDENDQTVKRNVTDDDITAQALLFFFAGFETASVALSFLGYELAVNPDVQKRLQEEIDQVIEEEKGVTYEGIMQKMKYLDMVVNEGLRKWAPGALADRFVTKRYVIPKEGEDAPEVILEKGDVVWIPIMPLHRDPEYFPDPEKFDPERFSDENKHKIVPFSYLPFGSGPRNCIGMRFALMEVKACLVYLLHKYSIVAVPKTQIPLKLSKNPFQLTAENGYCPKSTPTSADVGAPMCWPVGNWYGMSHRPTSCR